MLRYFCFALLLLLTLTKGIFSFTSCDPVCSDRAGLTKIPSNCPFFESGTITVRNYSSLVVVENLVNSTWSYETVNTSLTFINGTFGWCGRYGAFYSSFENDDCQGNVLLEPRFFGPQREMSVTFPLPWCVIQSSFGMCVRVRPTPFDPPGVLSNRRPLPSSACSDTSITDASTSEPSKYPLWDRGGYYRGTTTVYVDDSCEALAATPALYSAFLHESKVFYSMAARSADATFTPTNSTTGLLAVTAYTSTCGTTSTTNITKCVACNNQCSQAPQLTCTTNRTDTAPLNPNVRIRLVCRDVAFGYAFEVFNRNGPNLWFDWTIRESVTGKLVRANETLFAEASRYRPINHELDADIHPLFPGVTDGHGSAASTYFYIPGFGDSGGAGLERPFNISIYAGRPDYYVGNHKTAALVEFFNVTVFLNVPAWRAIVSYNVTALEKDVTLFPEDFPRQLLLALCRNATFRVEVQPYVPAPLNLSVLCNAMLDGNITWPTFFLNTVRAQLGLGNVSDPVPTCQCNNSAYSPCGTGPAALRPTFVYDYSPQPPPPPLQINLAPVCRVVGNPFSELTNVPPLPNLTDTGYNVTLLSEAHAFRSRLVPPYEIMLNANPDLAYVNYSTAKLGVLWRVNNNDSVLSNPKIEVRWSIGEYSPPTGNATIGTSQPVPFSQTNMIINLGSKNSFWLFSRTLNPHKLMTTARLSCGSPADCADKIPTDVPLPQWADNTFVSALADPSALPECQCHVNAPCDRADFKFITSMDVDVTLLPTSVPYVAPPIELANLTNCIPRPEVCNGMDDDCNGIIDDVAGVNLTCGYTDTGKCTMGRLKCNLTTQQLFCFNATYPVAERCGLVDYDCDGVNGNVAGLGLPCGSDEGACSKGTLICPPGLNDTDPVCNNSVTPIAEICDNGLDDDCNGLIDDGCPSANPGGGQPPIYIVPPVAVPTTNTLPAIPSVSLRGFLDLFLYLAGITVGQLPPYNWFVLLIGFPVIFFYLGGCVLSATRDEGIRVIRRTRDEWPVPRPAKAERKTRDRMQKVEPNVPSAGRRGGRVDAGLKHLVDDDKS